MSNILTSDYNPISDQYLNSSVYHDQNSLSELKRKGRDDNPEALREAAKQFESIFTGMMLKSMRAANAAIIADPLFDSAQLGMYQDMYDEQLSLHLSKSGSGLGLTDILVKQLSGVDTTNSNKQFKTPPIKDPQAKIDEVNSLVSFPKSRPNPEQKSSVQQTTNPTVNLQTTQQMHPIEQTSVADIDEERGLDFSSPSAFVQSLWPYAQKAAKFLELDPKMLIAQAALETGWGKFVMKNKAGDSSKNLFGIKSSNNWSGEVTSVSSLEVESGMVSKKQSDFRVYQSYADSFSDYANFIKGKSRYQQAVDSSKNSSSYIKELQKAGYATDPNYATKINTIFSSSTLSNAIKTFTSSADIGLGVSE